MARIGEELAAWLIQLPKLGRTGISQAVEQQARMAELAAKFGASKSASTLLVLFIPSHDRSGQPIDQQHWVEESLTALGTLFGGATAFPKGRGVWRDELGGSGGVAAVKVGWAVPTSSLVRQLLFDEPVIIQCYTAADLIEQQAERLREFLVRMGTEAKQGAIGLVIDRDYLELRFPLPDQLGS